MSSRSKIKVGQIWKKKESRYDIYVVIRQKANNDYWRTVGLQNRKKVHKIRERDLYDLYKLVGSSKNKQFKNIKYEKNATS